MKFNSLAAASMAVTVATATATTEDPNFPWQAPTATDMRGPCPGLNTLANHGYLPRSGGNITLENAVSALGQGMGFNASLATIMWQQAIFVNPAENATFFTLNELNVHNVLEHDASISRSDAFFGNNHVFNQTVFDFTQQYWVGDTLVPKNLVDGKLARQVESKAFNPDYRFTTTTEAFSLGEMAAPILVLGDIAAQTAPKSFFVYLFENERLPFELGWVKNADITLADVTNMTTTLGAEVSLFRNGTGAGTPVAATDSNTRRGLHGNLY